MTSDVTRSNSGITFYFKKLEPIQGIMLTLDISKFWSNSLGIRFQMFAYAKVKLWNLHVQFPGNWAEFGIILNDFKHYNRRYSNPSFIQ